MRSNLPGTAARSVLIGLALSMWAGFAGAADKPFAAPQLNHASTSATGGLAQVTFSLLLVLAVIFGAAWALKRLRGVGQRGASTLRIIANLSLGPKERAVLIQVGQQQLLWAWRQAKSPHSTCSPRMYQPKNHPKLKIR